MIALPVSVFSAALLGAPGSFDLMSLPDVSAYMEIVDDEDLEATDPVVALAGYTDPRFSERPTELLDVAEDAVLVG